MNKEKELKKERVLGFGVGFGTSGVLLFIILIINNQIFNFTLQSIIITYILIGFFTFSVSTLMSLPTQNK